MSLTFLSNFLHVFFQKKIPEVIYTQWDEDEFHLLTVFVPAE